MEGGENEDDDVRIERQRVTDLMTNGNEPPIIMVHVSLNSKQTFSSIN